jgi:hypothetical protein
MTSIIDRLRTELEQLGEKAKDALQLGRLQLERTRVTSLRNDAARDLGLLAYGMVRGTAPDPAKHDALLARLDDLQAQLAKVDREIAAVRGEEVSVGQDPPPPAETAESEVVG